MITGAAQMDGAILVVSAPDGAMPLDARARSARPARSTCLRWSWYLNKCDMIGKGDEELARPGRDGASRGFSKKNGLLGPETPDHPRCRRLKALEGDASDYGVPSIISASMDACDCSSRSGFASSTSRS